MDEFIDDFTARRSWLSPAAADFAAMRLARGDLAGAREDAEQTRAGKSKGAADAPAYWHLPPGRSAEAIPDRSFPAEA
jgi:hypothetical protein